MTGFLHFYSRQSVISDPGSYVYLFRDIPADIAEISRIVQSLVFHYLGDTSLFNYKVPTERLPEIETRYVAAILKHLMEMDSRPLTEPRPPEKRIVGCCRDFTLLALAMARYHRIPARARYGFATYFEPHYYIDHVVLEYWNGERWVMADTEMSDAHIEHFSIDFDVQNVPPDQFITAAAAWQMCRQNKGAVSHFGLGSRTPEINGWGFMQASLVRDFAALNRDEMLCWESWGLANMQPPDREVLATLDYIAALCMEGDAGFDALRSLYRRDLRLMVSPTVTSFSPALKHLPAEVHWVGA